MIQFADDTLLYLFVGGCDQAILAAVMAGTILPLVAWFTCWSYPRVANRFFLFNLSLLGWSIPGNFVWLRLTESRF